MICARPVTFPQLRKVNLDGTVEVSRNVSIPCGKCYACLSNRKAQWVFRLQVEVDNSITSWFITLSQDNEHLEDVNKKAIQLFIRYLRRKGHKFKYYAIGEYGSHTYRPHYHAAIFLKSDTAEKLLNDIPTTWRRGFVKVSPLNLARINYVLHYHIRPKKVNGKKTFALFSKGLGSQLFNNQKLLDNIKQRGTQDYRLHNRAGSTTYIPRYYRKKYNMESPEGVILRNMVHVISELGERHDYDKSLASVYQDKLKRFNNQEKF